MGQHKTNPTAILAKLGKIPPKEKCKKMTIQEVSELVLETLIPKGLYKSEPIQIQMTYEEAVEYMRKHKQQERDFLEESFKASGYIPSKEKY